MSLVAAGLTNALGWPRWSETKIIVILSFLKGIKGDKKKNPQNLDSEMLDYPML